MCTFLLLYYYYIVLYFLLLVTLIHICRSPSQEKSKESQSGRSDPAMDSSKVQSGDKSTDQENKQEKEGEKQLSQPKERGAGRLSSFVQKEKNVLFPSGSNTVNRG